MRIASSLDDPLSTEPTVLTIGAFDGVHRGHQFLIESTIERSKSLGFRSAVLTFNPRPLVVLRPGSTQLTGREEKERLISALQPDLLVSLPFTRETSQIPAGTFLSQVLRAFALKELWIGPDFAFGHNREGTTDYLIDAGQKFGFVVHIIERLSLDGVVLSSTLAREHFAAGQIEEASNILGHFPSVSGVVSRGDARGRELGYPTANVATPEWQTVPGRGIYAGYLRVRGETLPAAVSVGTNPTFDGERVVIEAHVLNYAGNLYDERVTLDFVRRIRDELKFESVDELLRAMAQDVSEIRGILGMAEEHVSAG